MPFPASGTISYSRWGELVRHHAPAPTPDVDRVANAFRDWASHVGLRLSAPTIEKAFVTFCQGFRSRAPRESTCPRISAVRGSRK